MSGLRRQMATKGAIAEHQAGVLAKVLDRSHPSYQRLLNNDREALLELLTEHGEWKSLVMEALLTTILVSIILNTATGHRSIGHNAAIAVGSTVALLGLFASPISGASMNPARSLGPDIVANDYTGWWVYVLGPVIGAAIAVIIIGLVRGLPGKAEQAAAEGDALPEITA